MSRDKETLATPMYERESVKRLFNEMHKSMIEQDKERKERESDNEKFRTKTEGWSDSILPEGERPKYEMNKTKTYLDDMKESQRKLHKAMEPLAKKLCESYDTDREARLDTDFTREAGGEVKDCECEGITSRVKDQQRLMNMTFDELTAGALSGLANTDYDDFIKEVKADNKFNDWFDNYSFGYVPPFAKPLIKQWVKSAYLAALGEVK